MTAIVSQGPSDAAAPLRSHRDALSASGRTSKRDAEQVCSGNGREHTCCASKLLEGPPAETAPGNAQRTSLLDALSEGIRQRSFAETRLADLTEVADLSRKDFYASFASKRECLAALSGQALKELERALADELGEGDTVGLELAIAVLVDALTADPHRTRLAVRELFELPNERPADPRLAYSRSFRDLVGRLANRDPQLASDELGRRIVVGAFVDAIEGAVDRGRPDEIAELAMEVCIALLVPLRPADGSRHHVHPRPRRVELQESAPVGMAA